MDALRRNLAEWERIGAPSAVIDTLKYGVKLPFSVDKNSVSYRLKSRPIKKQNLGFVESEISKLRSTGVIEQCSPSPAAVSRL